MPPKKRQRLSPPEESSTAATPREAPKQHGIGAPSPEDLVNDPWTDEQNTALMKGLIKWKPVGMHKHFRMLSLANYLHTHGHEAEHTRIPGIWTKLSTLYNMKTLDEREDSYGDTQLRDSSEDRSATPSSQATGQTGGGDDGAGSGSMTGDGGRAAFSSKKDPPYFPFRLPEEPDFRARLFDKRIGADPPSSPPALKHQVSTSEKEPAIAESFSMYDAEELGRAGSVGKSRDSTPAASTTTRGRGGRGRGRGGRAAAAAAAAEGSGRRALKLKEEPAPPVRGGRGGRGRPRRQAEAAAEEEEDESEEENEDEEEEGEEGDGSGEEESAEESEEESGENEEDEDDDAEDDDDEESPEESEKKPPVRTRGTRGKGRGRGGGRGRGRGRRG